jgi:hypothetical protein
MRVLVVEDETMICMLLLQDMLDDLGHTLAGEAGRTTMPWRWRGKPNSTLPSWTSTSRGQPISPMVEVLVEWDLPFVFATGYGQHGVPKPHRMIPTLQKPFQAQALALALAAADRGFRN